MRLMRTIVLLTVFQLSSAFLYAQPKQYTAAQIHAHNDYEKPIPFLNAFHQKAGSIEVDVFLHEGELVVAHDSVQLQQKRRLEDLYLTPLAKAIEANTGNVYSDSQESLQLMVDIKSAARPTLAKLIERLSHFPALTTCNTLKIAVSGNRPDSTMYNSYPAFIRFDGELSKTYDAAALSKMDMMSDNLKRYTNWNGKGIIPAPEKARLQQVINKSHALGKKVRFWNAPDGLNAWYVLMELGVDYINTDEVTALATFINSLPNTTYLAAANYSTYSPANRNRSLNKPVKNIILFIGDGCGMAELYAGYTANKGGLNIFTMPIVGLSKTSSYDSYITDSAPGSTAFSSGQKTNNRHVGVDHTGKTLALLPTILARRKMRTGVITTGDVRDATPADFYAHQTERSNYAAIEKDLLAAPLDLLMGSGTLGADTTIKTALLQKFDWNTSLADVGKANGKPLLVTDSVAGRSIAGGRGVWLKTALAKSIARLQNPAGFLLVAEGAQIDYGGHANRLSYTVEEVLDSDRAVGEALRFADANGETLVIVTADHETGGLTLTAGDYNKGFVAGQFSTDDHTATPIPVFAYGPQAQLFGGVFENTELFNKILQALTSSKSPRLATGSLKNK